MKLTIFKRLVIGNMIVIGFVVFLGANVIFKLKGLERLSKDIVYIDTNSLGLCEKLGNSLLSLVEFEKKYIVSKDIDYYYKHKELKFVFEEQIEQLNDVVVVSEVKALVGDAKLKFQQYLDLFEKQVRQIKEQPADDDPSVFLSQRSRLIQDIGENLKQIVRIKNKEKTSKLFLSNAIIGKAIKITIIITIMAIALGIIISVTNTRAITGSIFLLEKQTREISKGRFNHIPSIASAPKEIEDLTSHFNVMCSRLKDLEVLKTDFISHFSHELRTPITSIKEASSMLNTALFNSDPKKQQELSQLIIDECDRLIKSIEKILDLSKMEVFKMEWAFSKADIVQVIQKSLVKFVPATQNKEIDLTFLPAEDIPQILLDEKRIEEVINNLISNALKYTPEKGEIIVKAELNREKDRVVVSVADNGCGIDEENLEEIFEKFKRIDSGNETLRGTGLGLAISKHIINAHKGEIWAESKSSKGTKIFFILPLA